MDIARFHHRTFALLNTTPVLDLDAQALLARIEAQYKIRIPEAIYAWFSHTGAGEILNKHHRDGHGAIPLEAYMQPSGHHVTDRIEKLLHSSWFPFLIECQGIGFWATPVNTIPDPPISFIIDRQPPILEFDQVPSFSHFIENWIATGQTFVCPPDWSDVLSFGMCVARSHAAALGPSEIGQIYQIDPHVRQRHNLYILQRGGRTLIVEDFPHVNQSHWYLIERIDTDAPMSRVGQRLARVGSQVAREDMIVLFQQSISNQGAN